MRASYWLPRVLLFLFCLRRCTPEQFLKALFSSREHQIGVFEKLCLFEGFGGY